MNLRSFALNRDQCTEEFLPAVVGDVHPDGDFDVH